jgi:type III pantothenate kinase
MKPDVVVDVGNSRIKWGRCREDRVVENASLPLDDPAAWEAKFEAWEMAPGRTFVIGGVNPGAQDRLIECLQQRKVQILIITSFSTLPIEVAIAVGASVGLDRLFNAVAARERVQREVSCFIVDAGSAVTVDWVDDKGRFRGGAILPGFALMARALHDYTSKLPLVEVPRSANPALPGQQTKSAIELGMFWAVAGGVKALLRQLTGRARAQHHRVVFLTGGDAGLLEPVLDPGFITWPEMTLEGIRVSAERLP